MKILIKIKIRKSKFNVNLIRIYLYKAHVNIWNFLFIYKLKLLICISGGKDSLSLMLCLNLLNFNKFKICSINHSLRYESYNEMLYLINLTLKFKIFICFFIVNNFYLINLRLKRLNGIFNIIRNLKLEYITTAHHLYDNIETFIMRTILTKKINNYCLCIPYFYIYKYKCIKPFLFFYNVQKLLIYFKLNWLYDINNINGLYKRSMIRKISNKFKLLNIIKFLIYKRI